MYMPICDVHITKPKLFQLTAQAKEEASDQEGGPSSIGCQEASCQESCQPALREASQELRHR